MPMRRFARIALAQSLVGGLAVVIVACVLITHAQAQFVNPPPPPPPPVFNPSSPNTVPQPSYTPLTPLTPSTSPSTPSTVPSGEVTSPVNEGPPRTAARSHRRASVATEATSPVNEGPPRTAARSHRRGSVANAGSIYRAGPIVIGPPPVVYSYIGYGYPCAWQRSWDGYWFRTSPCSW
jgi:hypothetical protein